jgi:hypothetical protein
LAFDWDRSLEITVDSKEIKGLINDLKSSRKEISLSEIWSELSPLDVWEVIVGSLVAWAYDLDWEFEFEVVFT